MDKPNKVYVIMKSFYNDARARLDYYPHSFVYDLNAAQDYTDSLKLESGDCRASYYECVYLADVQAFMPIRHE